VREQSSKRDWEGRGFFEPSASITRRDGIGERDPRGPVAEVMTMVQRLPLIHRLSLDLVDASGGFRSGAGLSTTDILV
jgi:hypothetical protein